MFITCLLDSQNIPKILLRSSWGSIITDEFLGCLRRDSLITDSDNDFSMHRSTQNIGLDYMLSIMTVDEQVESIKKDN